jgi:hypothetical protein
MPSPAGREFCRHSRIATRRSVPAKTNPLPHVSARRIRQLFFWKAVNEKHTLARCMLRTRQEQRPQKRMADVIGRGGRVNQSTPQRRQTPDQMHSQMTGYGTGGGGQVGMTAPDPGADIAAASPHVAEATSGHSRKLADRHVRIRGLCGLDLDHRLTTCGRLIPTALTKAYACTCKGARSLGVIGFLRQAL